MIVAVRGCNGKVMHKAVQYDRCEDNASIFKCLDCGEEFVEHEDSGCGG